MRNISTTRLVAFGIPLVIPLLLAPTGASAEQGIASSSSDGLPSVYPRLSVYPVDAAKSLQAVDGAKIEQLIRQLGSARFANREVASKALETIGEPALKAVRVAQNSPDLEIQRRATDLVTLLTRMRAPARAKAWAELVKLGGDIDSDTRTPDGKIGVVDLHRAIFRDADLDLFQWLDETRCLVLMGTAVRDAGLVHLKNLYRLESLELGETKVTDAGMERLGAIDTLRVLAIYSTRVTDAGLPHLKKLNRLEYLDLSDTQVTDAGLEHIAALNGLAWLNLSRTRVTDVGLSKLQGLRELQTLFLGKTKVTGKGVVELQKALPKLKHVSR